MRPDRIRDHCPRQEEPLSAAEAIFGESEAAAATRAFARRAAAVDATVLITGESGTGKGLLARAIHGESARRTRPFVAINCASVPDALFESEFFGHTRGAFTGAQQTHRGLIEQANGGTLFLDEIGELATPLQAKLLTAIEDREFRRVGGEHVVRVDIRVIAATSVDLERAVAQGRFRRDLYHRLLILSFRLAPLRDRREDIDGFIEAFLLRFSARYDRPVRGIEAGALDRLRAHAWPGNVRQLANAIESALLACDSPRIAVRHLPASLLEPTPAAPEPDVSDPGVRFRYACIGSPADEQRRIRSALARWNGNKTRAAAELGMARNTLREKLRRMREQPVAETGGAALPPPHHPAVHSGHD